MEYDELTSLGLDTMSGTAKDRYSTFTSTTVTREVASESMPYMNVTILASLAKPSSTGSISAETPASTAAGSQTPSSTSEEDESPTSSSEAGPASITGESSASHLALGLTGGLAGALCVAMGLL